MRHLAGAPGRHVTFGTAGADYRVEDGLLVSPHGEIAAVASMRRSLPHDVTNGLAAAALVLETGLGRRRRRSPTALASFVGPPHRIELVAEADGSRLVQRFEGDDPACRGCGDRRLRPRRAHRRRAQQGSRPGADGRRPRADPRRRRHRRGERRRRRRVRRDRRRRSRRHRRWPKLSTSPGQLPSPATSSCCRRAAPASTGTPTAGFEAPGDHFRDDRPGVSRRAHRRTEVPADDDRRRDGRTCRCARPLRERRQLALQRLQVSTERRPPRRLPVLFGRERVRFWDVPRGPAPVGFYVIAVVVTVFLMLGLVMVLSATAQTQAQRGRSPYFLFNRQLMWAGHRHGRAARRPPHQPVVAAPAGRSRARRRRGRDARPVLADRRDAQRRQGVDRRRRVHDAAVRVPQARRRRSSPPTSSCAARTTSPTCAAASSRCSCWPGSRPGPASSRPTSGRRS